MLDPAYEDALGAVGRTPMVRLARMTPPGSAQVFAKLENLNVGGSIKTRTAMGMIGPASSRRTARA